MVVLDVFLQSRGREHRTRVPGGDRIDEIKMHPGRLWSEANSSHHNNMKALLMNQSPYI